MFKFIRGFAVIIMAVIIMTLSVSGEERHFSASDLSVESTTGSGQIETGGPFAGAEFHQGSVTPGKISLYYPRANTIDASGDYWNRAGSRIMFLGIKAGDNPVEVMGFEPVKYKLTPFSVDFVKPGDDWKLNIGYRFCLNKPAMVVEIQLENMGKEKKVFQVFTHLETTLRTSSTYNVKDKAWSEYDGDGTLYTHFDDVETGNACVFTANAGEKPAGFNGDGTKPEFVPSGPDGPPWIKENSTLPGESADKSVPGRPITAFSYRKELAPGEKMRIVQIIGSCSPGEEKEAVRFLKGNYEEEVSSYESHVLNQIFTEGFFKTGDWAIDHSVLWAKGILAANRHYLDGHFLPMPCPAEYNFFFTHDALMTDMARVFFNPPRVKSDLDFIAAHADKDNIIPHAYYWKDKGYYTEFAGADNWNNLWFIIVSARYLRHSGDRETVEKLYPLMKKSLQQVMKNKKDGLIWGYRPDWWDIGTKYGPRAYMTILTIRASREFIYISIILEKDLADMPRVAKNAVELEENLQKKLWDKDMKYPVNYFQDGTRDNHYYIGSLLSAHFDLLDELKKQALVKTAGEKLLCPDLGIYNAFPMDFHKLNEFFKFVGNEAGEPYIYMNGGMWCQGNAWYALALIAAGKRAEALRFIKRIMTLEGIMKSPGGHPAMYEYRTASPEKYGYIDKPQFLWAAAWYLYCCYDLFGVRENEWNIKFSPYKPEGMKDISFSLAAGGKNLSVSISGQGKQVKSIKYDGELYPSAVIPEIPPGETVDIEMGTPSCPCLIKADGILHSARMDEKNGELTAVIRGYGGRRSHIEVLSPVKPAGIMVDGKTAADWKIKKDGEMYVIGVSFMQSKSGGVIRMKFKKS